MAGFPFLRPWSTSSPSRPRHAFGLLAVFATIVLLANGARADCYWPDGTENNNHQPCYSPHGGALGLCCSSGDVCLSSGVCMKGSASSLDDAAAISDMAMGMATAGAVFYRGSCMYREWSEGKNCPTICLKGAGISPHTDVGMIPCPGSDNTEWYCADNNMSKANCSTGAYIMSLAKPESFTTIGISPSKAITTATTTSTSSSKSATTTATVSSDDGTTTASGNVSAPGVVPTSFTSVQSGTPVATPTSSGSSSPTVMPLPTPPSKSNSSSTVPLAVGVTIGGASIIAAAVIAYFLWRRRKRDEPAPAESPPPRGVPDDEILNSVIAGSMFRSGSLLSRRPSKTYLNNMGAGDGQPPPPMPDTASILSHQVSQHQGHQRHPSHQRTDSLRSGSMLSSFQQYQQSQQQQYEQQYEDQYRQQHQQMHQNMHNMQNVQPPTLHQPHPQRHYSYAQARFSPDAVAMHNLRRTPPPPVAWGHHGPSVTSEPIPEIPYDGRRMAPYHGVPMMENNRFSELPG